MTSREENNASGSERDEMDSLGQLEVPDSEDPELVQATDESTGQLQTESEERKRTEKSLKERRRTEKSLKDRRRSEKSLKDRRRSEKSFDKQRCMEKLDKRVNNIEYTDKLEKEKKRRKKQIEDLQWVCCLCKTRPREILYRPCNHYVVCDECSLKVAVCPISNCWKPEIKSERRVYLA